MLPADWESKASTLFQFTPPEWRGQAVSFGEQWTLTKGTRRAVCAYFTHPTRQAEVRCTVDGEIVQSQADSDFLVLLDLAQAWLRQFLEKGWT